MCGIAGAVGRGAQNSAAVAAALRAMSHRGPDGEGTLSRTGASAGMVRLALVDLSGRGQQPLWSPDGRVAILFNGEMFNFRAERRRLQATYPFGSTTDAEVALALYLERGPSFVEVLRGMFSLALLDWRQEGDDRPPRLLLARDRFGIKPLYVTRTADGGVAFASEIKGLLASGHVDPRVDPEGLASYLRHGFLVQPACAVRGVRMLGAGSVEIHRTDGPVERIRFGVLPAAVPRAESFAEAASRLRAVLEEAVALHAFADAAVGAFLSGGVDSAGIAALMLRHVPRLRTYSLGWVENGAPDETSDAEATARRLGCEHASVRVAGSDVAEALPRFARDLDQPSVDGLNTWFVSRVAARDVKGVLSGLGADEWFGGYPVASRMVWLSACAGAGLLRQAARAAGALSLPLAATRAGVRLEQWSSLRSPLALWLRLHSVFSDRETLALLGRRPAETGEERVVRALTEEGPSQDHEPAAGLACRLDASIYMRSQLLRDSDATSMAHSLELRVPFVDAEVAAFARSCEDRYRLSANASGDTYSTSGAKRVLIEALRDVLPPGVEKRQKRGFTMPYETWIQGPLREIVMDATSDATVRRRGLLSPTGVASVRRKVERQLPGAAYPKLWSLMMLELWCGAVLDAARPGVEV